MANVKPAIKANVDQLIQDNKVMLFSKSSCPHCRTAKQVFRNMKVEHKVVELNETPDGDAMFAYLNKLTKTGTVPKVYINGKFIGGGTETKAMVGNGKLKTLLGLN